MSDATVPVLAIDGPSGPARAPSAGASPSSWAGICWTVARCTGWWRWPGQRAGLDADDEAGHAALAAALHVRFGQDAGGDEQVWLGAPQQDVTAAIRTEEAGQGASRVAAWPAVRQALLQRQRDFARPPGLVADGRDMGTVVFPERRLKIFLTASPEERA